MFRELRPSLMLLALLTALTGVAYPMAVLQIGQVLFPTQANGSLIEQNGKIIGSSLIGQNFTGSTYFHPRPSYAGQGYDAANSSGSNMAVAGPVFLKAVSARIADLKNENAAALVPVDLVTASGSGLDPDISVDAAQFQALRIATNRNLNVLQVADIIKSATLPPQFGFLGPPRVNVLELNRKLDQTAPPAPNP